MKTMYVVFYQFKDEVGATRTEFVYVAETEADAAEEMRLAQEAYPGENYQLGVLQIKE